MKFISSLDRFLINKKKILPKNSKIGLFTNQVSFSFLYKKYSFELLEPDIIFLLEHGFFSEFQDQVSLKEIQTYQKWYCTKWISLYGEEESSLYPKKEVIQNLNWLIIDLQDVGSRYYTFLNSVFYALEVVYKEHLECNFVILDRPNPLVKNESRRNVEGSPLKKPYQSFVGIEGVLHRHGFTSAELIHYFIDQFKNLKNRCKIWVVPFDPNIPIQEISKGKKFSEQIPLSSKKILLDFEIYPSPNMPSLKTAKVYTGQCLLEGTNLSEGRGTTKPFEIFGAPFITESILEQISEDPVFSKLGVILRKLKFIPTSSKYKNTICNGWQLHIISEKKYHSLLATMIVLKKLKQLCPEFDWYKGVYEFKSQFLAIEYLLGDDFLFQFINSNSISIDELFSYLNQQQSKWKVLTKKYYLYK